MFRHQCILPLSYGNRNTFSQFLWQFLLVLISLVDMNDSEVVETFR